MNKSELRRNHVIIDLVPENFIEAPDGHLYLIDLGIFFLNDPMWDLAALFLESEFTPEEEEEISSLLRE